jgi:hypothetical protein
MITSKTPILVGTLKVDLSALMVPISIEPAMPIITKHANQTPVDTVILMMKSIFDYGKVTHDCILLSLYRFSQVICISEALCYRNASFVWLLFSLDYCLVSFASPIHQILYGRAVIDALSICEFFLPTV